MPLYRWDAFRGLVSQPYSFLSLTLIPPTLELIQALDSIARETEATSPRCKSQRLFLS